MAEKSRKDGGQRYDWNLIMTDYIVHQDSSLRKIAEKYGIRFTTVKEKAKADSWFATKQEYHKNIRKEAATRVATKKIDTLEKLVEASCYAEDAIVQAVSSDPEYFYKHILTRNLDDERVTLDILNFKAMKDMMRVIKDVEDVKRSILDIKRSDQVIAAERLQLERERFEFEKQKAELFKPAEGNVIRIEGFDKEWAK